MDFDASLALSNIDFGTFHLYTSDWSKDTAWGTQWIKVNVDFHHSKSITKLPKKQDHATAQASAKKPVLFEEYGLEEVSERPTVYPEWQAIVEKSLAADTFWQIAVPCNPNLDKFAICADDANWDTIIGKHAAAMAGKVQFFYKHLIKTPQLIRFLFLELI